MPDWAWQTCEKCGETYRSYHTCKIQDKPEEKPEDSKRKEK